MSGIIKRAHWSNVSTFQRFYNKDIPGNTEIDFQKKIIHKL